MRRIEDATFFFLIVASSLAFAWILWPFYGAVLWGTVAAIVFAPMHRRLLNSMQQRRNLAALLSVLIIVLGTSKNSLFQLSRKSDSKHPGSERGSLAWDNSVSSI